MHNLFDVIPNQFFYIFIGDNKRILSDCVYLAYQSFQNDLSFSCTREQLLTIFQDYFETHLTTIDSEENLNNSRDKALYVLKRLKDCGWIHEEVGENYEVFITFEDYSIQIMDCLFHLEDVRESEEYSGLIYNIYTSFQNFDIHRGDLIFETAYENTKDLIHKLKNLNSNIKKYIQKLLDDGIKDDLQALLNSLLQEYQTKIIDRAYYNLTTYDNPSKYRQSILSRIQEVMDNQDYVSLIIHNIMERKGIEHDQAYDLLMNQKEYIMQSFEHIEDIMQEIDSKNNKFIESAIHRITFLLNNQNDIEGKINNIIKSIASGNDVNDLGNIYINQMINRDSLYVPRQISKPMKTQIEDTVILDEKKKMESIERIKRSENYSHKKIEEKVMLLLKNGPFKGSQLPLETQNDLIYFVFIYLYGFSYQTKYQVEPLNEEVIINHYRFQDFLVKER